MTGEAVVVGRGESDNPLGVWQSNERARSEASGRYFASTSRRKR